MHPLFGYQFADIVRRKNTGLGELRLNELSHSYPSYIEILDVLKY